MNLDIVQGKLKQFKGKVRVRWCVLFGDHLGAISAKRTQSAGERQSAYGALRSKGLRGTMNADSPGRSFFI